jgi:hypothetical protein
MSTQELCDKICADRHVIEIWSECAVQMNSKNQEALLKAMVRNWLILRTHAKLGMVMEVQKRQKKNIGKKSLRKNLKRLSNN